MNGRTQKSKALQARILSGSFVLLSGSGLATGINFAYNVAVARLLGPQGFGHATVVYTLLTLISAVTLSFQIMSAKAVAQQDTAGGKSAVYRGFHRGAWGCGVLVAVLLILFAGQITAYLNLPGSLLIVLLAIGAAFYVPLGSRRGYVQGAYGFRRLAANLVLEGAVRLGGSLLMIVLGFGVRGVIAANAAAIAVAYLAIAPKLAAPIPNPLGLGVALRETSLAMVFFSGQVLINNSDIVLVKHFFAPTAAGLYAAVAMVGRVTFSFASAVVNSMFPVVAGSRDEERKSLLLIATSLLLVLGIGGAMALGLRVAPAWVWTIFFGSRFQLPGPHGFPYLLALYALTTVVYSLSVVIITYEMSYRLTNTSWVQLAISAVVIAGICRFHSSLRQVILVQLALMLVLLMLVGVPFLTQMLRNIRPLSDAWPPPPIRLVRRVSEEQVIAEFLQSDFENSAYREYRETLRTIVFAPNFDDPNECAKRRALLYLRHRSLWKELPPETEWFEAEVREADLGQIQVFPRAQWRRIARGNFSITEVAERMRILENGRDPFLKKIAALRARLLDGDSLPGSVVLIGLNPMERLAILDGNHRFVAAVLEGRIHRLRFLCGLSPKMTRCCWYRTNPLTLTRYVRNLLRHLVRDPEVELTRLFESSG